MLQEFLASIKAFLVDSDLLFLQLRYSAFFFETARAHFLLNQGFSGMGFLSVKGIKISMLSRIVSVIDLATEDGSLERKQISHQGK